MSWAQSLQVPYTLNRITLGVSEGRNELRRRTLSRIWGVGFSVSALNPKLNLVRPFKPKTSIQANARPARMAMRTTAQLAAWLRALDFLKVRAQSS